MIKPEQIPDEVAFKLLDLYALWHGNTDQARAAIAAAINAWPNGVLVQITDGTNYSVVLPFQQEKYDD